MIFFSDVDECSSKSDTCHHSAICTNTQGSFTCTCTANNTASLLPLTSVANNDNNITKIMRNGSTTQADETTLLEPSGNDPTCSLSECVFVVWQMSCQFSRCSRYEK